MKALAGIEYAGLPGVSQPCKEAVMRFIQFGDDVTRARILSVEREHCLLLTIEEGRLVAVKSGFGSGYRGEGPGALAYVLAVLRAHGAEIDEVEIGRDVMERIDQSALTKADLEQLERAKPLRPVRWLDYLDDAFKTTVPPARLWADFPAIIPYALIDPRILDLALRFARAPDECLMTGYRRLEDLVRERTGVSEHGQKLFSQAFQGEDARLVWKDLDPAEKIGRSNLFIGTYMAYRNRRAHREPTGDGHEVLDEFLLLNHLYKLEKEAATSGG